MTTQPKDLMTLEETALTASMIRSEKFRRHRTSPIWGLDGAKCWENMVDRCYDQSNIGFKYYGAKGVRIHIEWLYDPILFLREIGPRPSKKHTVDRIDPHGNYEPGNVRWATAKQQNANKRNSIRATIGGVTKCLSEWIEDRGLSERKFSIYDRVSRGWSPEEAILTPFGVYGDNRVHKVSTVP